MFADAVLLYVTGSICIKVLVLDSISLPPSVVTNL